MVYVFVYFGDDWFVDGLNVFVIDWYYFEVGNVFVLFVVWLVYGVVGFEYDCVVMVVIGYVEGDMFVVWLDLVGVDCLVV